MTEAVADMTVIVAGNGAPGGVEACLEALDAQRDGAEVLVCEARPTPDAVRARFPWAQWLVRPDALVPELWREGLDRSRSDIVALTISPMRPADDWLQSLRRELETHAAVAGAIEPGDGLRVADWAEYFCRYAPDMLPFEARENPHIPGDNCGYRRAALDEVRSLYRDGFWEPEVNRGLSDRGVILWHSPDLVVRQGRSAGRAAFTRQRLVHGRAHGSQRGARFGRGRNVIGIVAAPVVAPLLTARMMRTVFARGRHRRAAVRALPLIALFNVAWALGEARGHLAALRGR